MNTQNTSESTAEEQNVEADTGQTGRKKEVLASYFRAFRDLCELAAIKENRGRPRKTEEEEEEAKHELELPDKVRKRVEQIAKEEDITEAEVLQKIISTALSKNPPKSDEETWF